MKYQMIDAREAPPKPAARPSRRGQLLMQLISDLAVGRVARIDLEGTETTRGTKTSISRVAKRMGRTVSSWDAEGVVFVELSDTPQTPRRRGRPPKSSS